MLMMLSSIIQLHLKKASWLLKLNISKCKTVSYCMKNVIDTQYFINDGCTVHEIEKLTNMKDLGAIFDILPGPHSTEDKHCI